MHVDIARDIMVTTSPGEDSRSLLHVLAALSWSPLFMYRSLSRASASLLSPSCARMLSHSLSAASFLSMRYSVRASCARAAVFVLSMRTALMAEYLADG